jgi:zinc protease
LTTPGRLLSGREVLRRLVVLAACLVLPRAATALDFTVAERTLGNGLRVLVHEDHSAPVLSSYVFYRSGSRNETRGETGIAHLFEHMMFNGGKKFGPGMFDDLIEGNGGSTNGYTSRDLTAYLNNVPREALPIVLDLESDRMAHLALTKANLEQERGIVMEERRLRIDNTVSGVMNEALYLQAFVRSPYRWNTLGFMADIRQITLAEARAYYERAYAPNNAILVLAGDTTPDAAFAQVERYFGKLARRPPPPPVDDAEPPQDGERRAIVRKNAELPAVLIGYKGVAVQDADRPTLDVVERLLAEGDSSRLHEDLVREHEVATGVYANNAWGIQPELFLVYAQARPGKTAGDLEARIDAVIDALAARPVGEPELRKAKNQLRAELVRELKTVSGKADQIGFFETVFGSWRALLGLEDAWEGVTPADVQRVTGRYLVRPQRTVIVLEPIRAGEPLRDGGAPAGPVS